MKRVLQIAPALMLGLVCLAASVEMASAQSIIRAVYRVTLTDPASGATFHTDRLSVRSWSSGEACEREKASFSGRHVSTVEGFGITNSAGQPMQVAMESADCIVIRE